MKHLIILGARGCGREVLEWAKDINEIEHRWDRFSFLDYDKSVLAGKRCEAEIIGNEDDYIVKKEDEFVCARGDGKIRKELIEKMEAKGAVFVNIIHPTAIVGDSVRIEGAAILYPNSIISADVNVGKGCIVNMNSVVAHDVTLGEYCTLSNNCDISGGCNIGDHLFMGVNAHIIPYTTVEDNVYICAGSTVMTRVRANSKMIGNPAKRVKGW